MTLSTDNFLAAIEQLTLSSGQVDFFNVTLVPGGSDTIAAFSPATLAVTASTNQAGVNDVDNPVDLRWDTNGDLLVANGGGAPGDNGNMACVPVGAIATGANASTTVTTNVFAPVSMAYDSRDGSVALANGPVSAPKQLAEYALTDHLLVGSSINWVEYQTRTSPALYYYSQAIPYRYKMPADSFYMRLSINYKIW